MNRQSFLIAGAGLAAGLAASDALAASGGAPQFRFQSSFWMNLHHTLYYQAQVLETVYGSGPSDLSAMDRDAFADLRRAAALDQQRWYESLRIYRDHYAPLSFVFDETLLEADNALAIAAGDSLAQAVPQPMRRALETAAPVYRTALWPLHDARNRTFIAETSANLARYHEEFSATLSRIYRTPWLAKPYLVDVVAYAQWEGSYGNDAAGFFHIVMSVQDPDERNLGGIDVLFHEASHSIAMPGTGTIGAAIARAAAGSNRPEPDQLWHAVIMYTPGRLAERLFDRDGAGPYTMVWIRAGLFTRVWPRYYRALGRHWQPYMDGHGTLETALERCVEEIVSLPSQE
ncbi:MAG TPA: hypothetical protein VMH02_10460 [Verrucomicrobiae bacterium]|nr:hypothetical protein [Verrucomicrobiae bacterium]